MPDRDEPEIYEKHCYARMILHHPFVSDPKDALLRHHVDWTAAYQSDCIQCGNGQTNMPKQVFRISLIAFLNLTCFSPKLAHCDPFQM